MFPAGGIDFRTSNSTVSFHRPERPMRLSLEVGKPTPSVA
jgi:molecular chaperone DnaK (HSP70)